ncbi:MAG: translation elongation factor Ts [Candidatus Falkowbacteria bacterium]|nr:translation elongation factor Ts [Candidatus Falkowbacteria bacterium]
MSTMEFIKKLRDMSGAGMVDCQKAFKESDNDLDKALELLRKKGIMKAAKRADRDATEGIIKLAVSADNKIGYILQISSETDFVARNEKFLNFANTTIELATINHPANLDEFNALKMSDGNTIKDNLDSLSGIIGEKLSVEKYDMVKTEGTVAVYSHAQGRIGVLVALDKAEAIDIAKDIAMQVAAANPKYITSSEVPQAEIDKEKEIYREQLAKEGKPANILENILAGKVNKYFQDICLVDQEFIKDEKVKISNLLGAIKVEKMIRYSL